MHTGVARKAKASPTLGEITASKIKIQPTAPTHSHGDRAFLVSDSLAPFSITQKVIPRFETQHTHQKEEHRATSSSSHAWDGWRGLPTRTVPLTVKLHLQPGTLCSAPAAEPRLTDVPATGPSATGPAGYFIPAETLLENSGFFQELPSTCQP